MNNVRYVDPNRLVMQFHITGRCNLRCKHCYRTEGDVETLSFEDVIGVIDQYRELRREYNKKNGIDARGHINLTGGEPMFRRDFRKILAYMHEKTEEFSYGILSNGTLIDEDMIACLKKNRCAFVQLSLDGLKKTHDALRKEGDHDRVLACARRLEEAHIRTLVSFTAHKGNYKELNRVSWECRKAGVSKFWSDRLVPIGTGEGMEELSIGCADMLLYAGRVRRAAKSPLGRLLFPKTEIPVNRALQFLSGEPACYRCSAGITLLTVDEFGNIFPCRRMPIPCGNVFENTLSEVWFENETFRDLRKRNTPDECLACPHVFRCRGGAKCQSYARFSDYNRADPACPMAER